MKVAFLDRDGTLNKDYPDDRWAEIKEPEILPGTIEGLKYLKKKGFVFIIITNQYTIGEGVITKESYLAFHEKLLKKLKENNIEILDAFYCPHSRSTPCTCHKPGPGLVLQAINKYNINLNESIFIGDSIADLSLAKKLEIPFFGIHLPCEYPIETLEDIQKYIK
ncbi:MAG: HAD-IIIA family hydrolase [Tissierellia bacterium]|nr:HAD-IIIA family hydrolase [Tissierellia bacterium]